MIIVKNKIFPLKGFKAISIMPFVFIRKDKKFNEIDSNHEGIHIVQQVELFVLGLIIIASYAILYGFSYYLILIPLFLFYVLYLGIHAYNYMKNISKLIKATFLINKRVFTLKAFKRLSKIAGHKAYRNIIFEKEAYDNEKNMDYLKTRKLYSYLKYFRNDNKV